MDSTTNLSRAGVASMVLSIDAVRDSVVSPIWKWYKSSRDLSS